MTRVLTVLGLLVLVVVVLPLGVWGTVVVVAGERPFTDQRVLAPAPGGVTLTADDVAVVVVTSPDPAVHVTTTGTVSLAEPSTSVGTGAIMGTVPSAPSAPSALGAASGTGDSSGTAVSVTGCLRCDLTVTLAVPPGTPTTTTGTATGVAVVGVRAPLRLDTATGPITARDVSGPTIEADTADAPITLGLRVPATVTADSGGGDITVTAPASGRYALDPESSRGTITATLPDDPTAPNRISAHAGRGNVVLSPP